MRFREAQGTQGGRVWERLTALAPWPPDWTSAGSSPPSPPSARQARQPHWLDEGQGVMPVRPAPACAAGVHRYRSSAPPQRAVAQLICETHMLVKHENFPNVSKHLPCILSRADPPYRLRTRHHGRSDAAGPGDPALTASFSTRAARRDGQDK